MLRRRFCSPPLVPVMPSIRREGKTCVPDEGQLSGSAGIEESMHSDSSRVCRASAEINQPQSDVDAEGSRITQKSMSTARRSVKPSKHVA